MTKNIYYIILLLSLLQSDSSLLAKHFVKNNGHEHNGDEQRLFEQLLDFLQLVLLQHLSTKK